MIAILMRDLLDQPLSTQESNLSAHPGRASALFLVRAGGLAQPQQPLQIPVAESAHRPFAAADGFEQGAVGAAEGMQAADRSPFPLGPPLQTLGQFLQPRGCLYTRQRTQISLIALLRDARTAGQVSDSPPHRSPGLRPLPVAFFTPVHLEVLRALDGRLHPKHTPLHPQCLAVSFHRIPAHAVFDPYPLLAFPQIGADLPFKLAVHSAMQGDLASQKTHYLRAAEG